MFQDCWKRKAPFKKLTGLPKTDHFDKLSQTQLSWEWGLL
jgi:hypothetical protein